ncbi:unnamed protein product [Owenia fusiformis]|uniref:Sodium/myo-inositol cotransporter n=1 Tax=Owenia fusiformis TaxID=6347 RepID=A0A8J1U1G7_OWEFU|nr:unnamed protein product [Owenia fusiformis]
MESKLDVWDFVAVGLYFAAVIVAGLISMCRNNRGTVSGYFLAGRYMIWLPVGASLFASNIGSEHFIGLAGSGAAAGIGVGAFELNAGFLLQLLGWVMLPVYIASGVATLPQFMRRRFGGTRIQIYLSCLSLLLYILTKVSVNLYSGAIFIQQSLGWNIYLAVCLLLLATAICTVTGGLAAVIYTDTLQALVMVIGASILSILGFMRVGGMTGLREKYMNAIPKVPNSTLAFYNYTMMPNTTCGVPKDDSWIMLRNPTTSDMPWPGFILGQTPASVWYWCADQMMVQRALAAKSLSHAQGGTLFAGYLKLLPLFLMVLPGMISRVLYTDEVACADEVTCMDVCQNPAGCSNIAYPKLVLGIMPSGLRGVMLAVMLAALMSDLTSIFNSASTLFTIDIYKRVRKSPSVRELMYVGRGFVLIMVVIGVAWIPLIQQMQGGELYHYIQSIAAYLAPPIACVYLLAILWKRVNEQGAFWGLMIGLVVGMVRMVLDFIYKAPSCGEIDTRPGMIAKVHYMYFAMLLFWITGIVMIVISLLTKAPDEKLLVRTTYWTRFDKTVLAESPVATDEGSEDSMKAEKLQLNSRGEYGQDVQEQAGETDKLTDNHTTNIDSHLNGHAANGDLSSHAKKINNDVETAVMKEKGGGDNVALQTTEEKHRSILKRGYDWFCGFDTTEEGLQTALKHEAHLQKITSLKQDPRAKIFLNINLVIIFIIGIFLYIYFSIPQ